MAQNGMRDFTRTLGAGDTTVINVDGDYYHVLDATSELQLSFDDLAAITREEGIGGDVAEYKQVRITSAAAQTVVIALGYGTLRDSRASVTGTLSLDYAPANQITARASVSVGAGATVLLAAADATRKNIRVGVKSSEADGVYIGDSGAGAATPGGWLEIGGTEYLETEAAVYAYNPGAVAITVNVMTQEKI